MGGGGGFIVLSVSHAFVDARFAEKVGGAAQQADEHEHQHDHEHSDDGRVVVVVRGAGRCTRDGSRLQHDRVARARRADVARAKRDWTRGLRRERSGGLHARHPFAMRHPALASIALLSPIAVAHPVQIVDRVVGRARPSRRHQHAATRVCIHWHTRAITCSFITKITLFFFFFLRINRQKKKKQ